MQPQVDASKNLVIVGWKLSCVTPSPGSFLRRRSLGFSGFSCSADSPLLPPKLVLLPKGSPPEAGAGAGAPKPQAELLLLLLLDAAGAPKPNGSEAGAGAPKPDPVLPKGSELGAAEPNGSALGAEPNVL